MSVWVSGYFGRKNVGDEAILLSILNQIKGNLTPVVFSSDPSHTAKMNDVCSLPIPPIDFNVGRAGIWYGRGYWLKNGLSILRERYRVNAHLYCGGGMINDHVPNRMVKQGVMMDALAKLARNSPIALLAVGADKMKLEPDRYATKVLLEERVTYCSVRDQSSYEALCDLGIDPSFVHLAEDIVFSLDIPSLCHTLEDNERFGPLGVNLRPLFNEKHNKHSTVKEKNFYIDRCSELIAELIENFGDLVLFPFGPDDYSFLNEISQPKGCVVEPFTDDPVEVLKRMSKCSSFIGMRYHSVVFSLLLGIPCVPLPYSSKVGSICCEMGLDPKILAVGNGQEMPETFFEVKDVLDTLNDLVNNSQQTTQHYRELVKKKRCIVHEDIGRCFKSLLLI